MVSQAPIIKPVEDNVMLGIGMVILAVAFFASGDTVIKYLAVSGVHASQAVFMRYFVALVLVLAFFLPRYGRQLFYTQNLKLEIIRAFALLGSTLFNFLALEYLPLTVTGAVFFLVPLLVTALSVPLLGEKVGPRRWIAILVGFVGVLIIVRPGGNAFHWALVPALATPLCFAFYNIINRKLAGVDSVHTQQFYLCFIGSACVFPFMLHSWVWPQSWQLWVGLCAVAIFGFIGHLFITTAHRLAEASTLAPFAYPQLLFVSVLSWLVFDQPPDRSIFIGAPLVVGSGLYIWLRERRLSQKRVS